VLLRFFKLFSISFLLLVSHISLASSKTIDGGAGTDSLVVNYSGISGLGDFAISESGDYIVLTHSNGDTVQFKNVENLTVGSIAYTATGTASNGYNVVNGYVNTSERTLYLYPGSNATTASLASGHQFEQVFGTKTSCITGDYTITGSTGVETLNLNVTDRTGSGTDECFTGGWIIDLKAGNDVINSGKLINADSIDMGAGDDSVSVMFGADAGGFQTIANANLAKLDGGAGQDTIRYDESANTSGTISLTTSGATNFENIIGSPGAETITGDANANYLAGGNSSSSTVNDTINGAGGNDMLMASYSCSGCSGDKFAFVKQYWPYANNYTTEGTFRNGSSTYWESEGDNTLNGGAGDDILFGAEGEDTLDGGTGQDNLIGGRGIDTFVIRAGDGSTTLANADVIQDFKDGTDLIGMAGGLQYNQLTIEQGTGDYANLVLVRKTDTGEYLAVIHTQGQNSEGTISASDITEADFSAI